MRELAIDLLRGGEPVIPEVVEEERRVPPTAFNPFGIAIPLLLMGGVLVILFPLMGLLLFLGAAVMMLWGVVVGVFSRR